MAKILIVDDNPDMLDTLEHLFNFYDFEVARAQNGQEGIEAAEKERPGLIILDALMPVMSGFEACEKLKSNDKTREIPVIFLSANYTKLEHQQRGLELGADDYILKPFNAKELISKVNSLLHRKELIEQLRADNRQILENSLQPGESEEPILDPLTGIYNESFFHRRLREEHRRSVESGENLTTVLLDVDLFRNVNEVYGEQTADYVLLKIANIISRNRRPSDLAFRLEKNRFAVILPQTGETGAFGEAERLRTAILQTEFFDQDFFELKRISYKLQQSLENLTVSIGIAASERGIAHGDLLKRAEVSLHKAKSKGRNTTIRYSEAD